VLLREILKEMSG